MPRKHKIYYALAALHLLMIALFTTHFANWGPRNNPVFKAATTTGYYTGSNNVFSFFAPGLSDQPYVIYKIQHKDGHESNYDFTSRSPDFTNRLNNIYGYLVYPEGRPVLAASLANAVLKRHPTADKIRVAMVVQQIPSMQEYRNGARSKWRYWFNFDFQNDTTGKQP